MPADDGPYRVNRTDDPEGIERAADAARYPVYERVVDRLTRVGERAGNVFVYSSAYLAFIAVVYVAVAMALLSVPPNPAPIVMGLIAFAVYANDRLVDVDADAVSSPDRTAFVRTHGSALYVLAAAAYGIAVALSVLGGPVTLTVTLVPGLFWVLYATEWIPDLGIGAARLKEVLVLNSGVVAFAWAVSAVLLPLGFADVSVTASAVVVFAYFFLRSFANTEIPNVRDVDGDRAAGVATLPVVFGVERTRHILYALDLVTIALVGGAALLDLLAVDATIALLVGLTYSLGVSSFVGRIEDEESLAVAAECEYLVVGLAMATIGYAL